VQAAQQHRRMDLGDGGKQFCVDMMLWEMEGSVEPH